MLSLSSMKSAGAFQSFLDFAVWLWMQQYGQLFSLWSVITVEYASLTLGYGIVRGGFAILLNVREGVADVLENSAAVCFEQVFILTIDSFSGLFERDAARIVLKDRRSESELENNLQKLWHDLVLVEYTLHAVHGNVQGFGRVILVY